MKFLTKIMAIEGNLVATIPKEIVKEQNLREGELVKIEVKKVRKIGFGSLKGIKKFTEKERREMWGE
jgi:antitoxin component of MazEF toxin-antitoxin module